MYLREEADDVLLDIDDEMVTDGIQSMTQDEYTKYFSKIGPLVEYYEDPQDYQSESKPRGNDLMEVLQTYSLNASSENKDYQNVDYPTICGDEEPGTSGNLDHASSQKIDSPVKPGNSKKPIKTQEDLRSVIANSINGIGILSYYESHKTLTSKYENSIAKLVVAHELKHTESKKLSSETLCVLRSLLSKQFPSTELEVWYSPYRTGPNKEKLYACGKLHEAYKSLRAYLVETGITKPLKSRMKKKLDATLSIPDVATNRKIVWLQKICDPVAQVKEYWKETYLERKKIIDTKQLTPEQYFSTFLALKSADGFELLLFDFEKLYPDKGRQLLSSWTNFKDIFFTYCRTKLETDKTLMKNLTESNINLNEKDDDLSTVYAIKSLILHLCPCNPVHGSNSIWRPGKAEIVDSLILCCYSNEELRKKVDERKKLLTERGLPLSPFMAVMMSNDVPSKSHVFIFDVQYTLKSPVLALDLLLKTYQIFNIRYPLECRPALTYLQVFVYDIKTTHDQYFKRNFTLKNSLKEIEAKKLYSS